ncbi:LON peptidase substrate-binding domain-containing protein [Anaerolineales bacterium]
MIDIPLFPLNLVLFPQIPLKLHIFEKRYKALVKYCQDHDTVFGIVLIQSGRESLGPLAETYKIGCTANIVNIVQMPSNRLHLEIQGQNRFEIVNTYTDKEHYLRGLVNYLDYEPTSKPMQPLAEKLSQLLKVYISMMSDAGKTNFDLTDLSQDPQTLCYIAASLLNISNEQKQAYLEESSLEANLKSLISAYELEIMILDKLLTIPDNQKNLGEFSIN